MSASSCFGCAASLRQCWYPDRPGRLRCLPCHFPQPVRLVPLCSCHHHHFPLCCNNYDAATHRHVSPCSPAAYWGLASALCASLTLLIFIYLYVARPAAVPPSACVLLTTGLLSAVGVGAGVGGFAAYLGIGITNTLHGDGESLSPPELRLATLKPL